MCKLANTWPVLQVCRFTKRKRVGNVPDLLPESWRERRAILHPHLKQQTCRSQHTLRILPGMMVLRRNQCSHRWDNFDCEGNLQKRISLISIKETLWRFHVIVESVTGKHYSSVVKDSRQTKRTCGRKFILQENQQQIRRMMDPKFNQRKVSWFRMAKNNCKNIWLLKSAQEKRWTRMTLHIQASFQ